MNETESLNELLLRKYGTTWKIDGSTKSPSNDRDYTSLETDHKYFSSNKQHLKTT